MTEYELKSQPSQCITIDESCLDQARALVGFATQPPYDPLKTIPARGEYPSLNNVGIFTKVIDIIHASGTHLPVAEDELVLRVCLNAIERKSSAPNLSRAESQRLGQEARSLIDVLDGLTSQR